MGIKNKKIFLLLFALFPILPATSQYFGQNKVQYRHFDFKVYETPHFRIYHYLKNTQSLNALATLSERWYTRHQAVFKDTSFEINPVILYNNHADFQQTTIIEGMIGVGTSGVTEGFRTRVIMPFLQSNKETSHVFGHELVHVFQYNMMKNHDSLMLSSIMNIPIWMIEGLSEYLSIGRKDAFTSMWMRDAVKQNRIPSMNDLVTRPDLYFPYRYGHAAWAFITGLWGDDIIRPLFINTALYGFERGFKYTLGVSPDTLSVAWKRMITAKYKPLLDSANDNRVGELLFSTENAGEINISPSISPDGENIIFLSDKDVISLDLFLANPNTRKISHKITRYMQKAYIDEYKYFTTSGSWSPNSKKYAVTTFIKGQNKLLILDVEKGRIVKKIRIPSLESFSNPGWSPDGNRIVLAGQENGQSDLYLYNLQNGNLEVLTNDWYSDFQPAWSPDGNYLVFVSDRGPDTQLDKLIFGSYKLCIMDMRSYQISTLPVFPGADNIDPHFSPDGHSVYFLSDADGFRNLYRYDIADNRVFKLTDYYTGICGITSLSPAISISQKTGDIIYTLYEKGNYSIYKVSPSDLIPIPVNPTDINTTIAVLPPADNLSPGVFVNQNLENHFVDSNYIFREEKYHSKFRVEYIGSTGVGVGVSQYETAMYGGVSFWFSDILKRNQIFTAAQVNGEVEDFGGAFVYINKEHRVNWGSGISHVPYRYSFFYYKPDSLDGAFVDNLVMIDYRTYIDELSLFSYFPVSRKNRFETGIGITRYSFTIDSINNYYTSGYRVDKTEKRLESPKALGVYSTYVAYVGDDSDFGFTSPMKGYRYRAEVEKNFGDINLVGVLFDYRKYFFIKPVSLAFRSFNYTRLGPGSEKALYPLYIGYDYYLHGYNYWSMERYQSKNSTLSTSDLIGSRMIVMNTEFRFPFSGHRRLSFISSKFFYTDLICFFDGGLAFSRNDVIKLTWEPQPEARVPVYSTGIALRFNLFGMMVLEPYYAYPFQRQLGHGVFGLALLPGGW